MIEKRINLRLLKKLSGFFISFLFFIIIGCDSSDLELINNNSKTPLPPYQIDYKTLEETSKKFQKKEEPFFTFGKNLLQKADMWINSEFSTIVDKIHLPVSGDKHDYYSVGPYWWPDSTKENGLPYIRKDGYRNPERREYDSPKLSDMIEAVTSLTTAFIISNDIKYKNKAVGFLKTWFLTDSTRMNPNLEYGQAIPGITNGRGIGIIETWKLIDVVDAIGILYRKNALNKNDFAQLQKWFKEYTSWLTSSQKGIDEKNWHNNHGTSYDLQVISFSLFVGDTLTAKSVLDSVISKRVIKQIECDGSQPYELERTKSLSYSIFNVELFVKIAVIAERFGRNLWSYESEDGRSIYKAILFLSPFLLDDEEWKYQELSDINELKLRFFKIINISNQKNEHLDFNKYFKFYDTNNYIVQKEILLRPNKNFY